MNGDVARAHSTHLERNAGSVGTLDIDLAAIRDGTELPLPPLPMYNAHRAGRTNIQGCIGAGDGDVAVGAGEVTGGDRNSAAVVHCGNQTTIRKW